MPRGGVERAADKSAVGSGGASQLSFGEETAEPASRTVRRAVAPAAPVAPSPAQQDCQYSTEELARLRRETYAPSSPKRTAEEEQEAVKVVEAEQDVAEGSRVVSKRSPELEYIPLSKTSDMEVIEVASDDEATSADQAPGDVAGLEQVLERMGEEVEKMRRDVEENRKEVEKAIGEEREALGRADDARSRMSEARDKQEFFKDLSQYVGALLDCLAVKAPQIEKMEQDMLAEEERAAAVARKVVDSRLLAGDPSVLSDLGSTECVCLAADYGARMSTVWRDVDEEFCGLGEVVRKLGYWKEKYPETYDQAYCAQVLPLLLLPLVRTELGLWDPFRVSLKDVPWYSVLRTSEVGGNTLVRKLLCDAVVPLAKSRLLQCWDPFSFSQSKDASALCAGIIEELGDTKSDLEEEAASNLLGISLAVLKGAAFRLPSPLSKSPHFDAVTALLRSALCWSPALRPEVMISLVVDDLFCGKLAPAAMSLYSVSDALSFVENYVLSLPPAWRSLPQFSLLRTWLSSLPEHILSDVLSSEPEKQANRLRCSRLSEMLL